MHPSDLNPKRLFLAPFSGFVAAAWLAITFGFSACDVSAQALAGWLLGGFVTVAAKALILGFGLVATVRRLAFGRVAGVGQNRFLQLVRLLLRGCAATAIVWLPAGVYVFRFSPWGLAEIASSKPLSDPVTVILLLFGIAYLPLALMLAASERATWHIFNPITVGRSAGVLSWDYTRSIAAFVLVVPAVTVAATAAGIVRTLPVPVVASLLADALCIYPLLVWASATGLIMARHEHFFASAKTRNTNAQELDGRDTPTKMTHRRDGHSQDSLSQENHSQDGHSQENHSQDSLSSITHTRGDVP